MNFLAHLALAGTSDDSRIGNLLGDFEKGTPHSLRERLPSRIVDGIMMHRHLDRFTDDHPAFRQARSLLSKEQRRFAGISVDIFFDHFLFLHWNRYYPGSALQFATDMETLLFTHRNSLGNFAPYLNRLQEEQWLKCLQTEEGIALTLQRVSQRSIYLGALHKSFVEFKAHSMALEDCFLRFYPDAREQARKLLPLETNPSPTFP